MDEIIDPSWIDSGRARYRWVEKDPQTPEFGEIYYNPESNLIYIRRVTHEFENKIAQTREGKSLPSCVYIGEL